MEEETSTSSINLLSEAFLDIDLDVLSFREIILVTDLWDSLINSMVFDTHFASY